MKWERPIWFIHHYLTPHLLQSCPQFNFELQYLIVQEKNNSSLLLLFFWNSKKKNNLPCCFFFSEITFQALEDHTRMHDKCFFVSQLFPDDQTDIRSCWGIQRNRSVFFLMFWINTSFKDHIHRLKKMNDLWAEKLGRDVLEQNNCYNLMLSLIIDRKDKGGDWFFKTTKFFDPIIARKNHYYFSHALTDALVKQFEDRSSNITAVRIRCFYIYIYNMCNFLINIKK